MFVGALLFLTLLRGDPEDAFCSGTNHEHNTGLRISKKKKKKTHSFRRSKKKTKQNQSFVFKFSTKDVHLWHHVSSHSATTL